MKIDHSFTKILSIFTMLIFFSACSSLSSLKFWGDDEADMDEPKALNKAIESTLVNTKKEKKDAPRIKPISEEELAYMSGNDLNDEIKRTRKAMEEAAKSLDFIEAARLRDQLKTLQEQV